MSVLTCTLQSVEAESFFVVPDNAVGTGSLGATQGYDIAIVDVVPRTKWVYAGRPVETDVTVANKGNIYDNNYVAVEFYYMSRRFGTNARKTVATEIFGLAPAQNKTLTFTWNTAGLPVCQDYTVGAMAYRAGVMVPSDSDSSNNVRESSTPIRIRISGDVNGDDSVDISDLLTVASTFGSFPGGQGWNPAADITGPSQAPDDVIDLQDMSFVARNFETFKTTLTLDDVVYQNVNVFLDSNASATMRMQVNNEDSVQARRSGYITVNVSSSVHSKEAKLSIDETGAFYGTLEIVESSHYGYANHGDCLQAKYGDTLTVKYLQPSSHTVLIGETLFAFPKYVADQPLADLGDWQHFDQEGIPLAYYAGPFGWQVEYNPVTVSQYALALYHAWLDTGNSTYRENFLLQADWLVKNAELEGNYSVWEYKFDLPIYDLTDPWVSSMAQGQGLSVLVRAYAVTGNSSYLETAETALNAFNVESSKGGVKLTDVDGIWFEEYSDVGAMKSKVLNGFIFSLFGLYEYWFATNNTSAYALFSKGTETLAANIARYDNELGSYYDLLGHVASSNYHKLHVYLLRTMYELTKEEIFQFYSDLFQSRIPSP
jgi:heparosan-N-sulfate-glucuronate 5-epimerase